MSDAADNGNGTVSAEQRGKVLVVSVDDGKANAFSVPMLAALDAQIDAAEADDGIGAVVIAGNDRAFFAGLRSERDPRR